MATISRCILFDDDLSELRARQRLAEDSIKRLLADEKRKLEFDDDLVLVADREEFLTQLLASRGHVLILADMHGVVASSWGNLGARLLRAAAEHPDVGNRTWRVLWTRHNHPDILEDVRPYAHAVALYPSDVNRQPAVRQLDDAIWNVLASPPTGAEEIAAGNAPRAMSYPMMRGVEQWEADLEHRLDELLVIPDKKKDRHNKVKSGDDTIALRLYRGDEAAEINLDLGGGPESRASVDALLSRIIAVPANKVLNKTEAKEHLVQRIAPIAQETAHDVLSPPITEDALKCVEAFRAVGLGDEDQRDDTWLPPDLYRLACAFLDAYAELKTAENDQRKREIPANALTELWPIQGEAFDAPAYLKARADRFTDDDLTYAAWTLRDTYRALRATNRV